MKKLACVVSLALFSAAPAHSAGDKLSYGYAGASYISVDVDDSDFKVDGFGVDLSAPVGEHAFLVGSYSLLESEDLDPSPAAATLEQKVTELGLGFRAPVASGTDVNVVVSFVKADLASTGSAAGFIDVDDTGYGLAIGLRHLATAQFEIGGGVSRVEIFDESSTALTLGALLHLGTVSIGGSYTTSDDADSISVGVRLNF